MSVIKSYMYTASLGPGTTNPSLSTAFSPAAHALNMSKLVITAAVVVGLVLWNHLSCDRDGKPGQNQSSNPSRPRAGRPRQSSTSSAAPNPLSSEEGKKVREPTTWTTRHAVEVLREEARVWNKKMQEARGLAKSARERGDRKAEQSHNQKALMAQVEETQHNKKAANLIFDENNKNQLEGTVDLRDLLIEEAVHYAKKELQSATRRPNNVVQFIVGNDLHVKDAKEKMRSAVEELCKQRRLSFSPDPANSGVLIVQC